MSHQFRRRILNLTLLPLPLMLAVCGVLAWQISRLHTSLQWVSHTQEVLSTIHLAERLMIDQETGTRGYLYTADPLFLDPSKVSEQRLGQSIADLRRLTSDNPSQQSRISALETGYNTWLAQTLTARQGVRRMLRRSARHSAWLVRSSGSNRWTDCGRSANKSMMRSSDCSAIARKRPAGKAPPPYLD